LEFAAGGFNLFLVARNETALKEVGGQCRQKHGVETEIFAADLSCADSLKISSAFFGASPIPLKSCEQCRIRNSRRIRVVGPRTEHSARQRTAHASLQLTKAVLPAMIARHSGNILTWRRCIPFLRFPFQSVYGACKAFLLSFSSAVQTSSRELESAVTVFARASHNGIPVPRRHDEKHKHSGMTAERPRGLPIAPPTRHAHRCSGPCQPRLRPSSRTSCRLNWLPVSFGSSTGDEGWTLAPSALFLGRAEFFVRYN